MLSRLRWVFRIGLVAFLPATMATHCGAASPHFVGAIIDEREGGAAQIVTWVELRYGGDLEGERIGRYAVDGSGITAGGAIASAEVETLRPSPNDDRTFVRVVGGVRVGDELSEQRAPCVASSRGHSLIVTSDQGLVPPAVTATVDGTPLALTWRDEGGRISASCALRWDADPAQIRWGISWVETEMAANRWWSEFDATGHEVARVALTMAEGVSSLAAVGAFRCAPDCRWAFVVAHADGRSELEIRREDMSVVARVERHASGQVIDAWPFFEVGSDALGELQRRQPRAGELVLTTVDRDGRTEETSARIVGID